MKTNLTKVLSLRIPRDAYRKLEKIAELAGLSISKVATLFLERRCKQPTRNDETSALNGGAQ